MAEVIKAYKFKLEPTKAQVDKMCWTLEQCRFLYNCALEQRIRAFGKSQNLGNYQQQKSLKDVKLELPEYKDIHAHVLQDVLTRLDKAYKAFFRRVKTGEVAGFPRFQGKNRYDSFHFKEYKQVPTKTVYIPKIGNVKIRLSREVEGRIKTLTVKRDSCGDWFAIFTCDKLKPAALPKTGLSVGVDVGVITLVASSDGEIIKHPKFYQKQQKALRKAQRRLARRMEGSRRRKQAKLAIAKIHRKIQRQRADFAHKLSRKLVNKYDLIVFEDLNVQGMSRSNLGKTILDAGWTQLRILTEYKAEYAGKAVQVVKPNYSSQECSRCGFTAKENRKSQASFSCLSCGHTENADINASKVILGRADLSGANRSGVPHAVV